jgi:uncharacterized membrane protein
MDDPQMNQAPQTPPSTGETWAQVPPSPQAVPPPGDQAYGQYPPQQTYAQPVADQGLTDTAAGAIAYLTIIPAIIFLVLEPYNRRPFVKFHAFQCLGLAVVWFCLGVVGIVPILGQIVFLLGGLVMLVLWILSIVKASQGSYFKLPFISDFASKQSGYPI